MKVFPLSRGIKKKARAIGIDDGSFVPKKPGKALIVGVLLRADGRIEGILSTSVKVDGLDSTQKITRMLKKSRFCEQASFVFLDGINFAGFNFIDIKKLNAEIKVPVIAVMRKKPLLQKIKRALSRFNDKEKRFSLIEKAGSVHKAPALYFQCSGLNADNARKAIKLFSLHSNLPEPVRLAHLIASGVSLGESTNP